MSKRNRRTFTKEQKDWAIDQYTSEAMSAEEIAAHLETDVSYIYRWKTLADEKRKGLRISELQEDGNSADKARRLFELELEVEEYKKKLAEQVLISDLLKKLLHLPISQRESELASLIKTTKSLKRKKGPVK